MIEGQDALLIDVENNTERNNLDIASGGITVPQPVGFIGFPQPPLLSNPVFNLIVCNIYFFDFLFIFLFKLFLLEFRKRNYRICNSTNNFRK